MRPADYDLWASLVGVDEFSWAKMGPCFDHIASFSTTPSKSPIRTRLISQSPRLRYWSAIARRGLEESGFVPLDINGGLREVDGSGPVREVEEEGNRQAVKDVFGEMTECIDDSDSRQQVRSTALRYFEDVVDPLYSQEGERKKEKFEVWTSLRVERVVFEGKKAVGVHTRFGIVRARREVVSSSSPFPYPPPYLTLYPLFPLSAHHPSLLCIVFTADIVRRRDTEPVYSPFIRRRTCIPPRRSRCPTRPRLARRGEEFVGASVRGCSVSSTWN